MGKAVGLPHCSCQVSINSDPEVGERREGRVDVFLKHHFSWGTWVAPWVKHPTLVSAQVVISGW